MKSVKKEEQEGPGQTVRTENKGSERTREKKRESSPATGADSESKKRKQESEETVKTSRSQTHPAANHSSSSRQLSSKSSRDKAAIKLDSLQPPPSKLSPSLGKSDIISPATLSSTKTMSSTPITAAPTISTSSSFSPSSSKPLASPSFIALSPATSLNTLTSTMVTSSTLPSPSFSAKFSNSSHSPSYSSTASSVSTVSSLPSPQASMPSVTPSPTQPVVKCDARYQPGAVGSKPPVNIAMGPPKVPDPLQMVSSAAPSAVAGVSPGQLHMSHKTNVQPSPGSARLGNVMQVRCKSVSALLYVAKYESGSKGKCILVNEEWMTPNEFEEKAGSKAKKYLSSIKCSGRPLRAYVNSGELRGTGPIPVAKPAKISSKPKNPQPIAPAPGPGGGGPAGYGLPPPGMSPAHMSASMPQSLTQVAMMQNSVGQPILLNQSNLAVSIAGQSQMSQAQLIQPMTFTLAPMSMQGQQLHHQQLQHHQLQGTSVGQQLHSSADYILQHK